MAAKPPKNQQAEADALPAVSPEQVRAEFLDMLVRDWLGPAGGEDEVLYEYSIRDRYLVGALAPSRKATSDDPESAEEPDETPFDPIDEQGELAVGGGDVGDDGSAAPGVPDVGDTAAFIPSSLGLTVSLGEDARDVIVQVSYGRYERHKDEALDRPYWQRVPVTFTSKPIRVRDGLIPQIHTERGRAVYLVGLCRKANGGYSLTLFLVNGQAEPKRNKDETWVFQPEITMYAPDGSPIFAKRAMPRTERDVEDRSMEMLYRGHQEFAVGHGASVSVESVPGNPARALKIATRILPHYEVAQMTARSIPDLVTDMAVLAQTPQGGFRTALSPLVREYQAWLNAREAETQDPDDLLRPYVEDETTARHLAQGELTLSRIQAGIDLLDTDPQATLAFQFANAAMAQQRIHTLFAEEVRRERKPDINLIDVPENRSWRPFQLGFILLNLPAMVDPTHPDRSDTDTSDSLADLLWFPTGGGKTEAYLGLTAFTLATRRLQGNLGGFDRQGAGVAVIMRYTLRLLTLQQFQRATALIAACEVLRREDSATWGDEPFRIGLWVGSRSTPNYTEASARAITEAHGMWRGNVGGSGTPVQLKTCPWCGSPIVPGKNIRVETVDQGVGRTLQYCSDTFGECPFGERRSKGEGLPIVVVDEEIYRRLPALLIATVDKFAQMPWKGATQMLFGRVNGWCPRHGYRSPDLPDADSHPKKGPYPACRTEPLSKGLRPPDLIIQDELHLISGPLGTLVGLYETAIDALCMWQLSDITIRPKVVASTATIRKARDQVHSLFQRRVNIFPPSGLDAFDNFFAIEDRSAPGRLYLGICASGTRLKSVLIRAYVTTMSAAQALYERYGAAADPYMTLVGYFNSVRELGGMLRVMDDAVQSRLRRMDQRGLARRVILPSTVEELTSRKSAIQIPDILDRLESSFGTQAASRRPLDAVLATNMISVGVDVGRLGVMVVAGQPKATAEYIQATSRVGRRAPGVVIAVYNWTRPRDLSHYERFEHYHATFYQQVEALSVTPFAPRALDRALSAVFVALVRLFDDRLNKDDSAGRVQRDDERIAQAMEWIIRRAGMVTERQDVADLVRTMLERRLDEWLRKTRLPSSQLTYTSKRGAQIKLLSSPEESDSLWQPFTSLNSMRDVETPIRLILDDYRMDDEQ
ncbi:MAG: DISARM system helicase DrmA [Anaerolineae bacterium]|nr:DISARM system helicase DrmA [Anaerolineae bacterium]